MTGSTKTNGKAAAFEFTSDDYVPSYGGAFKPYEAKVKLDRAQVRMSSNGNPSLGVMVRLISWTKEELTENTQRKNRYVNRTAWAWKAFGVNQTEQYLDIASQQISRLVGKVVKFNHALTKGDVDKLAAALNGLIAQGTVIGTIWVVSPDNGDTLTFWQSQQAVEANASEAVEGL